ncbi:glycoside hydrolase family 32 protein [Flavobacterium daejeonense]|uniref:glycoside hydrolase family 32 protein n=1 Tax=Flavobacterium daejeonense TaxID=350893 RepID=UPI0006921CED|nr:glycoside hydrolase family 32 protein [Flavobacterium daejeonense]
MKIKNIILGSSIFFSLLSCSQNDDTYIGGSISGGESSIASIYPIPPSQWMGGKDPYYSAGYTGDIMPFFDSGKFHIYFLHDAQNKPAGKGFHDIHEFQTTDLAHFSYNGQMIPYGNADEADFGVGTGSVVKVGNTYYFYYTGHNAIPAFLESNPRESVLCATSTDLKNWTKISNFKITAPAGYLDFDFRDPHVFFNEELNKYSMLVSTQTDPGRKAVLLHFTCSNPATGNWEVQVPIYTTTAEENYLMMECADVFKMGNYWYLLFSENWGNSKGTHYRMATSLNGPWINPAQDMIDGEYFYAAKTASDGNKRYAFGWTARKSPQNDAGNKEWAGNMVIHQISQNTDGTLSFLAPQVVKELFTKEILLESVNTTGTVSENNANFQLSGNASVDFKAAGKKAKINATISLGNTTTSAGFKFEINDAGDYYKIVLEPENNRIAAYNSAMQLVAQIPFAIAEDVNYEVELICDGSICTFYIGGNKVLSNRIYSRELHKWGLLSEGNQFKVSNLTLKTTE